MLVGRGASASDEGPTPTAGVDVGSRRGRRSGPGSPWPADLAGEGPGRSVVGAVDDSLRPVASPFTRRPLLTVFLVAAAVAVGHGIWIWTNRRLGAIDPDESGYIATAFRYHSILLQDPLALPRAIGGTGNGPLVPLLSVPLLLVGPDDPRTVLLMQPILMVVAAVAVAGIARRLAGPAAAVVSGCLFVTLPTVVFAAQTYWYGLGTATCMALAVWALLSSERLTNRWTYAYGACFGAMLLARTMAIGYIPALALAGGVVAWWRRDSIIGLVKAMMVAAVVAGPWWFVAREAVFDYLFSYGYGKRAGLFGSGSLPERIQDRVSSIWFGIGPAAVWCEAVVALAVVASLWRSWRRRSGSTAGTRSTGPAEAVGSWLAQRVSPGTWSDPVRGSVAVGATVALGVAALSSTTNSGVWFELPLVALLVPFAVALGARAPVTVRALALPIPVVAGVLQLACSWWFIAPDREGVPLVATKNRVAQYEYGFEQYDTRFSPLTRDLNAEAAGEWWRLSSQVERYLRALDRADPVVVTIAGNFQMFNSNTVELAAQIERWQPRLWVPDTVKPPSERAAELTPIAYDNAGNRVTDADGQPVERVLVLALHDQHLFTPDAEVRSFDRQARAAGWAEVVSFDIPRGGEVVVLRHPDRP